MPKEEKRRTTVRISTEEYDRLERLEAEAATYRLTLIRGRFSDPFALEMVMQKNTETQMDLRRAWMGVMREYPTIKNGDLPMLDYLDRAITVISYRPEEEEKGASK